MAMHAHFPASYHAKWTEHNVHLRPQEQEYKGFLNTALQTAKRVSLSFPKAVLSAAVRWAIVPACFPLREHPFYQEGFDLFWKNSEWEKSVDNYVEFTTRQITTGRFYPKTKYPVSPHHFWFSRSYEEAKLIKDTYTPKEITLTTPDGETLHGHFLQHKNDLSCKGIVVLLFPGAGELYKKGTISSPMIGTLAKNEVPVSYLMMDSRGINRSSGKTTRDGLLIDADSLYQYAQDALGFDQDKIVLYGNSLGGSIASHLKAMHQESKAPLILNKTFGSLDEVVDAHVGSVSTRMSSACRWLLNQLGWTLESADQVIHLNSDVHVFYREDDGIIPLATSMKTALIKKAAEKGFSSLPKNFHLLRMSGTEGPAHREQLTKETVHFDEGSTINAAEYLRDKVFSNITDAVKGAA